VKEWHHDASVGVLQHILLDLLDEVRVAPDLGLSHRNRNLVDRFGEKVAILQARLVDSDH
jgi:hypothetical protein